MLRVAHLPGETGPADMTADQIHTGPVGPTAPYRRPPRRLSAADGALTPLTVLTY